MEGLYVFLWEGSILGYSFYLLEFLEGNGKFVRSVFICLMAVGFFGFFSREFVVSEGVGVTNVLVFEFGR